MCAAASGRRLAPGHVAAEIQLPQQLGDRGNTMPSATGYPCGHSK